MNNKPCSITIVFISGDAETLVYIRRSVQKRIDKGKAIMQESEPPKKIKKKEMIQMSLDEDIARSFYEEEQAQILYHAIQNITFSKAKVRKNMCTYLKNQGGYKMKDFKGMSYEEIRPIFEKVWDYNHAFVPKDSEIEKEVMKRSGFHLQQEPKKAEGSLKRKTSKERLDITKRQKTDKQAEIQIGEDCCQRYQMIKIMKDLLMKKEDNRRSSLIFKRIVGVKRLHRVSAAEIVLLSYYCLQQEEKLDRKNEMKARATLLMSLLNKDQMKFHSYQDAKLLMEAIEKRYGGNKESKKAQKTLLKQQYENFSALSSEIMDQTFDRLQKLISQLEFEGETIKQEDMNLKLLRSLPSEWKTHSLIWRNKAEIETITRTAPTTQI
ncbi:hypothetical protein Tco_0333294 [Tanacetum coccineum]